MSRTSKTPKILIENDLQSYFFESLSELNLQNNLDLPTETIYYSSTILKKYSQTHQLFEVHESGEIREKVLGVKLLEASDKPRNAQKQTLKDIGDTALCLCGIFNEYIDRKIVDSNYYSQLGAIAYDRLNTVQPNYLDIPNFYQKLSKEFDKVSLALKWFTKDFFQQKPDLIKKISGF